MFSAMGMGVRHVINPHLAAKRLHSEDDAVEAAFGGEGTYTSAQLPYGVLMCLTFRAWVPISPVLIGGV